MKLYIANGTKQIQHFIYRLPENWAQRIELVIPQGMQVRVPEELSPEDVESILEQHRRYGFIKAEDVDRSKPYSCLCYSIDKPVAPQKIEKLFNHNNTVLEKRADETLFNTALANNKLLEDTVEETARTARRPLPAMNDLKISITEVPKHGSPQKTQFFRNGKDASGTIHIGRT